MITFFCVLSISGAMAQQAESVHLPHREALKADVHFWKKIFTEVSLNQYLIHDSDNLSLIYKTVTMDTSLSKKQREKQLETAKDEVKNLLLKFHKKQFKIAALTHWEHQVYHLFNKNHTADKFLKASKRIRAQQGIKENFMAGVKRSFAYLPHIRRMFAEEGLPVELGCLPHVESSFNPVARSHVGAAGMWQFMRRTGRQYMKVNRVKDERYDPIKSTWAAARLLKLNYKILQDWALAITAYNHGLGSMRKAKKRYGDYLTIRDKYLRRSFGFASKNFYPEVLAVVEICDSLDHYFPNIEKDPLLIYQEITLPRSVNIRQFAKRFEVPLDELKRLNPGFRRSVWQGKRSIPKKYNLRLPITAQSEMILAKLGASKAELGDIRLAQRVSSAKKIRVTNLREIYARRKMSRTSLRKLRPGVYTTPPRSNMPDIDTYLLALNAPGETKTSSVSERPLAELSARQPSVDAGKTLVQLREFPEKSAVTGAMPEVPLDGPAVAAARLNFSPYSVENALSPQNELSVFHLLRSQSGANAVQPSQIFTKSMPLFAALKPGVETARRQIRVADLEVGQVSLAALTRRSDAPPQKTAYPEAGYAQSQIAEPRWDVVMDARTLTYREILALLTHRLKPNRQDIIVFPRETLGHYAEWLGIDVSRLRRINGLSRSQSIKTGQRFRVDFSLVTPAQFLEKRLSYHVELINKLLTGNSRIELIDHTINSGENIWNLAHKKYKFPVNLLLYFNDLNKLEQLYPGDIIKLPVIYH